MGQFITGIILFLVPGLLPAYMRYKNDRKGNWFCLETDVLQYAFLILVCASGIVFLMYGDVVFSFQYTPDLLVYVIYFVAAYGCSLIFGALTARRYRDSVFRSGGAVVLIFSALWIILFVGIAYDDYAQKHIVINEVCSSNLSLVLDEDGENSDYIELYNPSFTRVSLEGWCLTDREEATEEHCLGELFIDPRSYLLVFADGSARKCADGDRQYEYLGFRIKEQGETLTLIDDQGNMIDRVEVPSLASDISYARLKDGTSSWSVVRNGTPGKTNEGLERYVFPTLEAPVFSAESGFYSQAFELMLSAGADEKIYYTLDGSRPSADSRQYTAPLLIQDASNNENYYAGIEGISQDGDYQPMDRIDKATVVRALCVNEAGEISEIISRIYFVGFDEKNGYDDVKIMSVEGEPEDFFSEDRGIYVLGDDYQEWVEYGVDMGRSFAANYTHADKAKERPVTITLFDEKKNMIGRERIGVRVRGGASRNLRQKGFNFYVREEYGEDPLGLCAKMLRTSGSIDTNVTMLRDVFNQSLVADRKLDIQPGEPCMVFLNGEYWGLYNLQTRHTEGYFEEQYGIAEDNLIVVKQDNRVSVGADADLKLYEELVTFAKEQDLSRPENYDRIGQMMDIQSFIDQYCFEIYIGNTDWPLNNVCCWRSRTENEESDYEDGKWRWALYDTDESTGIYDEGMSTYSSNAFLEEAHWFGSPLTTPLMSNLIENDEFRRQFTLTFFDMVNKNFAYSQVHDKLYKIAEHYAEPMVKSYHRFNEGEFTLDTFRNNVAVIDEYFQKRPDYIIPYFTEALNLSGREGNVTLQTACVVQGAEPEEETAVLAEEGGYIVLNTIAPELKQGKWSGRYPTDYPITVTARAFEGYQFVGWQGAYESVSETIEVDVPEEGICLRAVFETIE